jgi:transposase
MTRTLWQLQKGQKAMEVLYACCCGLDIHLKQVCACLLKGKAHQRQKPIQTFGTTTAELHRLAMWLEAEGCTHVAMESTGVYWKCLYNVLEGAFTLILVNAQHAKGLPGRKTDVGDAEWLADLLQHGLVRGSFVPPRALRELTRYRRSLVQERTSEVNRVHKVLEGANIKLGTVASDMMGLSGRAMLQALADGLAEPATIANLAKGKMRKKIPALQEALTGSMRVHQRFLLAQQLAHIDALERAIAYCNAEIANRLQAQIELIERLCTIPGIGRRLAEDILAEIGWDMSRFPTPRHLASWAGICPGNYQSAGKRKSGKTRKGSKWLRSALVEAANAAARTRQTYLSTQYHRLAARRGGNKAKVALAHTLLIIVYQLLREGGVYQDLGANYFDSLQQDRVRQRLVKRLQALGYAVNLVPNGPATQAA